jgi:hypothetical protein
MLLRNIGICIKLDEKLVFIGQRSGEPLKWRHISRNIEGHNIEDEIHCTVSKLDETFFEIFFSHL